MMPKPTFIPPDTPDSPTAETASTPILMRWARSLDDVELGRIVAEVAGNFRSRTPRERYAILTAAAERLCEVSP